MAEMKELRKVKFQRAKRIIAEEVKFFGIKEENGF